MMDTERFIKTLLLSPRFKNPLDDPNIYNIIDSFNNLKNARRQMDQAVKCNSMYLLLAVRKKKYYCFNPNPYLEKICKNGNAEMTSWLIIHANRTKQQLDLNLGLRGACKGGHIKLANFFARQPNIDIGRAIEFACLAGYRNIIDILIPKMAFPTIKWVSNRFFWGEWMACACMGGHKEIVDWTLENGASDIDHALHKACRGGNRDIVEFILTKCDLDKDVLNCALNGACIGGHMDLVKRMIELGASDFVDAIDYACTGGNLEIVQLLSKHCSGIHAFFNACDKGHLHIVKFLISKFARYRTLNFSHHGISHSSKNGHLELVKFFVEREHRFDLDDFKYALEEACTNGHVDVAIFLLNQPTFDAQDLNDAFLKACGADSPELVELLIHRGANKFKDGMFIARHSADSRQVIQYFERVLK